MTEQKLDWVGSNFTNEDAILDQLRGNDERGGAPHKVGGKKHRNPRENKAHERFWAESEKRKLDKATPSQAPKKREPHPRAVNTRKIWEHGQYGQMPHPETRESVEVMLVPEGAKEDFHVQRNLATYPRDKSVPFQANKGKVRPYNPNSRSNMTVEEVNKKKRFDRQRETATHSQAERKQYMNIGTNAGIKARNGNPHKTMVQTRGEVRHPYTDPNIARMERGSNGGVVPEK